MTKPTPVFNSSLSIALSSFESDYEFTAQKKFNQSLSFEAR